MKPYEIVAGQLDLINRSIAKAHSTALLGKEGEKEMALYGTTTDLERANHDELYTILNELSPSALGRIQAVLDDLRDRPVYES